MLVLLPWRDRKVYRLMPFWSACSMSARNLQQSSKQPRLISRPSLEKTFKTNLNEDSPSPNVAKLRTAMHSPLNCYMSLTKWNVIDELDDSLRSKPSRLKKIYCKFET